MFDWYWILNKVPMRQIKSGAMRRDGANWKKNRRNVSLSVSSLHIQIRQTNTHNGCWC